MASRLKEMNLEDPESSKLWLIAFSALARSKKWEDNENNEITNNFISLCGLTALSKIASIVRPKNIEDMNFKDIKQSIEKYLEPKKKLVIAERSNFYNQKQKESESVTEYLARLRAASRHCEFDSLKECESPEEEMIKLALISGFLNKEHKIKVLEKCQIQDMTIEDVIQLVQQLEQVTRYACNTNENEHEEGIHFNSNRGAIKSSGSVKPNTDKVKMCTICKKNHKGYCRKASVVCFKCQKRGHYSRECNFVDENDDTEIMQGFATNIFHSDGSAVHGNVVTIPIEINKKTFTIQMQEDTGASCSIISTKMWMSLNKPTLEKYKGRQILSYDGHELKVVGIIKVLVNYKGQYDVQELKVVESSRNFGLLGRDMLNQSAMSVSEVANKIDSINDELGVIKNAKAKLHIPDDVKPIFCRVREVPIPLQEAVDKELDKMIKMGVISKAEGGSEWASPLVVSRKANGKLRLCCDYKITINKYLVNDSYHPPDIETMFSKLGDAKVFSKFDLKSAYWQVELDNESKKLTTINTTKGLYYFNRLPFGVKTASSIFQRVIENVCSGLEGIIAWQDDLLVYAENDDQLKSRCSKLLERLNKRNVAINWEKTVRYMKTIKFIGHVISADGIKPDSQLVEKVRNVSVPKTKKEVESFIGLVNFYGTKIKNFASICEPINRLRKNGVPFYWGKEQQQAFEKLKEILATDPVVKPFSLSKELTITCDASEKSIGAIISQEGHPIMYISRLLTKAEQNYAVTEREALAIVWAVKRAEKFLLGKRFTIKTDHRALQYLFKPEKSLPKHTSARIQRWAIVMMGYDYDIEYVSGSNIPHVDAFSRLNFSDHSSECFHTNVTEGIHWNEDIGISWKELADETLRDRVLKNICERIKNDNWRDTTPAEFWYKKNRNCLTVEKNVVFLGTRPAIPSVLRRKLICKAHESHFGMSITKVNLKRNVWWPGMDKDVELFIRHCNECSKKPKANIQRELHTWEPATRAFERVHMDWADAPGIGNILILVDSFSGWPEAFICKDRSSKTVKMVLQSVFARFGVPSFLVNDNAKEFISNDVILWLKHVGTSPVQTPHYHPSSNGQVERMVQTLKRALKFWSSEKGDLHGYLQKVLLTYRTSRICSKRNGTPSELMFNREIRHPLIVFGTSEMNYTPKPGGRSEPCKFIVQNSASTAYVDCNGIARLAHVDQLKEKDLKEDTYEESDESDQEMRNEENNNEQRQIRDRRQPNWFWKEYQ